MIKKRLSSSKNTIVLAAVQSHFKLAVAGEDDNTGGEVAAALRVDNR